MTSTITAPPCEDASATTLRLEITGSDLADVLALLTKVRRNVRTGCPFGKVSTDAATAQFSVETR